MNATAMMNSMFTANPTTGILAATTTITTTTAATPQNTNNTPRYHLPHNPPYQIHHTTQQTGKKIPSSKEVITFQFGFSSLQDIANGKHGVECRGEEHEVCMIASWRRRGNGNNKIRLFMDGKEINISPSASSKVLGGAGRGDNVKFQHSWDIAGGHRLELIAYSGNGTSRIGEKKRLSSSSMPKPTWGRGNSNVSSSSSSGSNMVNVSGIGGEGAVGTIPQEEFRRFDLQLDGLSYFDFAKIYELGHNTPNSALQRAMSMGQDQVEQEQITYNGVGYVEEETRDEDEDEDDQDGDEEYEYGYYDNYHEGDRQNQRVNPMAPSYNVPSYSGYGNNDDYASYHEGMNTTNPTTSAGRRSIGSIGSISKEILKNFNRSLSSSSRQDSHVVHVGGEYSLYDSPASVMQLGTSTTTGNSSSAGGGYDKSTMQKMLKLPSFGSSSNSHNNNNSSSYTTSHITSSTTQPIKNKMALSIESRSKEGERQYIEDNTFATSGNDYSMPQQEQQDWTSNHQKMNSNNVVDNKRSSFSKMPKLSIIPSRKSSSNGTNSNGSSNLYAYDTTISSGGVPGGNMVHNTTRPWSPSSSAQVTDQVVTTTTASTAIDIMMMNATTIATTTTTPNNNNNNKKDGGGISSTFSTFKRKLSKRMESSSGINPDWIIAESREPNNDYGDGFDGYVDHESSINRSPSAMSYDYELMRESRSFAGY